MLETQNFRRVLVIEDDHDAAANLVDILQLEGLEVVCAHSLEKGLALLRKTPFDVIVSDRRLPDGMVENRLSEFRDANPGASILIVTAFGEISSVLVALRNGVTDYITKPIIPEDLVATLGRVFEKRVLEEKLRQASIFREQILATAEAIVLVLDSHGKIVHCNPFLTELTGWIQEELIGKDWFSFCLPEQEIDRVKRVFSQTIETQSTSGIINLVRKKNGQMVHVRWSNKVLPPQNGETQVLAIGTDITDLFEANERAMQSERLAAIGETMTAIAHESRNALQRIKSASEVLAVDLVENADAMEELDAIRRANSDLAMLLENVRSFAAPLALNRQLASLPTIWRSAWNDLIDLRNTCDAHLREEFTDELPALLVDSQRLEQVFRNLFENAIEAGTNPIEITVRARAMPGEFCISVTDNGDGVTEETIEKLFRAFFTTKPTGTGLGLSICQRIIEAHEGSINAAVASNSGACFEIRLPCSPQ